MANERTEEHGSENPLCGPRKGSRGFALLAAGLMAVSAVGYTVVNAPGSFAQGEEGSEPAAEEKCGGGEGTFTITGSPEKGFTAKGKGTLAKGCEGDVEGTAKNLSAKKDGEKCVIESKEVSGRVVDAKDDDKNGKKDEDVLEKGKVRMTAPLDGSAATVELLQGELTPESTDSNDIVTGKGTVEGHGITECNEVPTGKFTVKVVSAETKDEA
ncbi:hypothetical protein [Nocardia brasiliensis]|uniref:hypothetical protein n=1 Tax=Nocardia brasiliensis TaxID=37326 RepID=UPI00366F531C